MNLCNDIGYAFIKIVIITKSFVVGQCFHSCYKMLLFHMISINVLLDHMSFRFPERRAKSG